MSTILVTGGSGFVGSHAILKLLADGHEVRTTVRDLKRESEVRALLKRAGSEAGERLKFYAADLRSDAGWQEAVNGSEYVLHVASPFPAAAPKDESELIIPARDGTLRVLRASRDAAVKRVVITSSFAAIGYGHPEQAAPFNEFNWTDISDKTVPAYHKSKTIAERSAWEFIAGEGRSLELTVINPVGIFGPALGSDLSSSVQIVQQMLRRVMPALPRIYFGAVDVRDVVDLHVVAMTHPAAKGERFIATACESTSLHEIAHILKANLGEAGAKVPTREMPDWVLRIAAMFKAEARPALPELGKVRGASNAKAKNVLGWKPRSHEEAILSSARSLLQLGLA